MAINLATQYQKQTADAFYQDSVILGKTARKYNWDGVKSIEVVTIQTQAPGDYSRQGTSRYGSPSDVQDTKQILEVKQDKSVSLVVDKGDNTSQMMVKEAGKVLRLEIREQFVPMQDKYALKTWSENNKVQSSVDATVTKSNIVSLINKGRAALVNKKVPLTNTFIYIGATNYALLTEAPEFIGLEKLGTAALENGVVGKTKGMKVVEIPDDYLPSGVNFMIVNANCVEAPTKIEDAKVHQDPPGISGHLLEVRWLFDAFVLEAKADGIYVSKKA